MKSIKSIIISSVLLALGIAILLFALFHFSSQQNESSAETNTLTPTVTQTPTPTSTPTATPTPTPTATPTPTPTATPEPEYLGDLEEIPSGTLVAEDTIDYENLDKYFMAYEISDTLFERIYGDDRSFKTYSTCPRENLRYVKVLYKGFDDQTYVGEIMINYLLADDIVYIFKTLYENDYQFYQIRLVDDFNADDDLSIANNNTSAFNYRNVTGGDTPSNHAFGYAIDINPLNNPYVEYDADGNAYWEDPDVELYLDRNAEDAKERHMINYDDLCYQLFTERGWTWGGNWANPVDYQHFEKIP